MDVIGKREVTNGNGRPSSVPTEMVWPFSRPALMAGLRRYLDASSLRLLEIRPIPVPNSVPGLALSLGNPGTTLQAMSVGVRIEGDDQTLDLLLKMPPVSRRGRVLTAVGQREYGVYRRLAPHLPLLVPGLIAGDESAGWIILEALTGLRPPDEWTREDYQEAVLNLVAMHDRFWGLGEDLATFPWLARPLDADYELTLKAAVDAVEALITDEHLSEISDARHFRLFATLTQGGDDIVAVLRSETATLVHGDYWPGNIGRPIDGRQIVFDWQLAGIGPAILDLVGFANTTRLQLAPRMPVEEMIALYRQQYNQRVARGWNDKHFERLWDHAHMWLLMVQWLGRLATMHPQDYSRIHERFSTIWLEPAFAAVERQLGPLSDPF